MAALTTEQREQVEQAANAWLTLADPFASIPDYDANRRLLAPLDDGLSIGLWGINQTSNQYTPKIAVSWNTDLEALAEALSIWLALMRPATEIEDVPARTVYISTSGDGPGIYLVVLSDGRVGVGYSRSQWYITWQPDLAAALAYIQREFPAERYDEDAERTLGRVVDALRDAGLTVTRQAVGWGWAWRGGAQGRAGTQGQALVDALRAQCPVLVPTPDEDEADEDA